MTKYISKNGAFKMVRFIMMIGLPSSGKSTVAERLSKTLNAKIFSSDNYRQYYLGDENDQTQNAKIFDLLHRDMKKWLSDGNSAIFDATNVSMKDRSRCLSNIPNNKDIVKIAYVVNTPIEECIKRDKDRERTVGKAVISKFEYRFQFPQFFEGFDGIMLEYDNKYNKKSREEILSKMANFNQNNPHHNDTLGKHCEKVAQCFDENTLEYVAGLVHDIGKLFTQKTDDDGISHYYGHENVGAYYICSHPEIIEEKTGDFFDILFYVNYHMMIHDIDKSEKAKNKYKKLFGEDRYNALLDFGNADRVRSKV